MKVLVTASSKHGSTAQVAEFIVKELRAKGLEVDQQAPENVETLAGYDALIIGSAVYLTAWMEPARNFVQRFMKEIRQLPVWAFSVGMSGVGHGVVKDSRRIGPVMLDINARDHHTFPGRLDSSDLNLRERTIARVGGAVEGDYRDWDEVAQWAGKVAQELLELESK